MMTPLNTPENLRKLFEPNRQAALAMLGTSEKLAELQFDCFHRYTRFMMDEIRSMLDVHDGDSLQSFVGHQRDVAREMGTAVTEDIRRLSELGKTFTEEMQKAGRESQEAFAEVSESETRKSA